MCVRERMSVKLLILFLLLVLTQYLIYTTTTNLRTHKILVHPKQLPDKKGRVTFCF